MTRSGKASVRNPLQEIDTILSLLDKASKD